MSNYLGFLPTDSSEYYFVSYNSEDADRVSALANEMVRSGIPLWYDYGIEYGEKWESQINEKLAGSQAMILFFTRGVLLKDESYVQIEYKMAGILKKKIIVLLLDEIREEEDVPLSKLHWWVKIQDNQSLNICQFSDRNQMIAEIKRALKISENLPEKSLSDRRPTARSKNPSAGKSDIPAYNCLYCGKEITAETVLFCEKTKTQYTDNIRGDFLRRRGVRVSPGNKFPRHFYRVRPGENVVREDENGFPTMIEDCLANALAPEALADREQDRVKENSDFDEDSAVPDAAPKQFSRENHNIPQRACPHCHCELPMLFGTVPVRHIQILGGGRSGKTAFLVNLFQQAPVQLSARNLGAVTLEKESEHYLSPIIDAYEQEGTTQPTLAFSGLFPIVCRFTYKSENTFVIFHEIVSDQGTSDPLYMANESGIGESESLLLLLDPYMFANGLYLSEWEATHPESRYIGADCCRDPLDVYLQQYGTMYMEYAGKLKNVVCVITKLDMLLETDYSHFRNNSLEILKDIRDEHKQAVDPEVLQNVGKDISGYLKDKFGIDLYEKLRYTFGEDIQISLLGISTSTLVSADENRVSFDAGSSPALPKHRIIEPFLAALMYSDLIPVMKENGKAGKYHDRTEQEESSAAQKPAEKKKTGFLARIFGRKE